MSSEPPDEPAREGNSGSVPDANGGDDFRLRVSKDRMQILLECDVADRDLDALAEAIVNRLMVFGARKPPEKEALAQWLREQAALSPQLVDVPVLHGVPPQPPIDGYIEWGGDFFNPGFLVDEQTGRVNFRKRAGQRNVKDGQLLATVMQPVPGTNGYDVLGNILRTRNPRAVRVRAGRNVRADDTVAAYYAAIDGRIRWDNETLSVDQLYEVDGDIGLETGDISHEGAVLVHGDVLKGARLEALGDIEVMGVVDGAQIQTGGMLNVHGGITGSAGIRVTAAGGIHAKYMLDADVQSGSDVVVENEIMHSTVSTLGALLAPQSRVIGGKVIALGGIEIAQAGSSASVPTILVAGEDYSLDGKVKILRNKLALARQNVDKINAAIAPMRGKIASLPEKSKAAIRGLLQQLPKLETSIVALQHEIESVQATSERHAVSVILIRGRVYPETRLTIEDETMLVREEVGGPLKPVLSDGKMRLALTRMRTIARRPGRGERVASGAPEH